MGETDAFQDKRDHCPFYQSFKLENQEDQCSHPEAQQCGPTWCDECDCPLKTKGDAV